MSKTEADKKIVTVTTVKKSSSKILIIAIIIVVLALITAVYFYTKYQSASKNNVDANKKLIEQVSKLIELPKNETPTIAMVSDKTKLEKNAFYSNAENGDRVLIYLQAKKAILYRPSINKIIDVVPVNVGVNNSKTSPSISSSPTTKQKTVSLLILNGTKTAGLASSAKTKMEGKIKQVDAVSIGDTINNYEETIIVDPSVNKVIDDQLVALLGGTVSKTLPDGEKTAKQDIIIILGSDFK